ncbi:hypothetical protein A1O3_06127 [Capronia epimyces CBS 606.96]|uniref:Uncharacterized protein n=1 Tax=Capronia epimyces CBS 606.96 TaxID=1182542 RepID=W9YJ52_9EURO|nr:uncharacterized protein A1O3_06127 [Capronia epimyces CBS 606.96]EXJ82314.1 hypothetical protein A1O3_06127 [Capronia epimyces CBS 606.96]
MADSVDDADAVRAKAQVTGNLFANSVFTWSSYAALANGEGLSPAACLDLPGMLGHGPAFLDFRQGSTLSQSKPMQVKYDDVGKAWVTKNATWRTTNGECDLPNKVIPQDLLLGIPTPSSLFSGQMIDFGTGLVRKPSTGPPLETA